MAVFDEGTRIWIDPVGDIPHRKALLHLLKNAGATTVQSLTEAGILLVNPESSSGMNYIRDWSPDPDKLVLHYLWVKKSIDAGHALMQADNWGDCMTESDGREVSTSFDEPDATSHLPTPRPTPLNTASPPTKPSNSAFDGSMNVRLSPFPPSASQQAMQSQQMSTTQPEGRSSSLHSRGSQTPVSNSHTDVPTPLRPHMNHAYSQDTPAGMSHQHSYSHFNHNTSTPYPQDSQSHFQFQSTQSSITPSDPFNHSTIQNPFSFPQLFPPFTPSTSGTQRYQPQTGPSTSQDSMTANMHPFSLSQFNPYQSTPSQFSPQTPYSTYPSFAGMPSQNPNPLPQSVFQPQYYTQPPANSYGHSPIDFDRIMASFSPELQAQIQTQVTHRIADAIRQNSVNALNTGNLQGFVEEGSRPEPEIEEQENVSAPSPPPTRPPRIKALRGRSAKKTTTTFCQKAVKSGGNRRKSDDLGEGSSQLSKLSTISTSYSDVEEIDVDSSLRQLSPSPTRSPSEDWFKTSSGESALFYVQIDIKGRKQRFMPIIKTHGGKMAKNLAEANYAVLRPVGKDGQLYLAQCAQHNVIAVTPQFLKDCAESNKLLPVHDYLLQQKSGAPKKPTRGRMKKEATTETHRGMDDSEDEQSRPLKLRKRPRSISPDDSAVVLKRKQKDYPKAKEPVDSMPARQISPTPPPKSDSSQRQSGRYNYTTAELTFAARYIPVLISRDPDISNVNIAKRLHTKISHHTVASWQQTIFTKPLGIDMDDLRKKEHISRRKARDKAAIAGRPSSSSSSPKKSANQSQADEAEDFAFVCRWFADGKDGDGAEEEAVWKALTEERPCKTETSWMKFYSDRATKICAEIERLGLVNPDHPSIKSEEGDVVLSL